MKRYRRQYSQREAARMERELKYLRAQLRDKLEYSGVNIGHVELGEYADSAIATAHRLGYVVLIGPKSNTSRSIRAIKVPEVEA